MDSEETTKEQKHAERARKVQQEYSQKCAEAGQAQYRIIALGWEIEIAERELKSINQRLKELNELAVKLAKNVPEQAEVPNEAQA